MSADAWLPQDRGLLPGFERWRAGDLQSSLEFFEAAVVGAPTDPDAWRGLGSVQWTRGDFAAAAAAFRQALALQPWSPMHWTTVGLALRDLCQFDRAANTLRVATLLDRGYAPAWNELANVHVDLHHPDVALTLYDVVLALDTTRAVYYHNRGVAHRMCGDTAAARADFEHALELDAEYSWSISELSRLGRPTRTAHAGDGW